MFKKASRYFLAWALFLNFATSLHATEYSVNKYELHLEKDKKEKRLAVHVHIIDAEGELSHKPIAKIYPDSRNIADIVDYHLLGYQDFTIWDGRGEMIYDTKSFYTPHCYGKTQDCFSFGSFSNRLYKNDEYFTSIDRDPNLTTWSHPGEWSIDFQSTGKAHVRVHRTSAFAEGKELYILLLLAAERLFKHDHDYQELFRRLSYSEIGTEALTRLLVAPLIIAAL